MKPCNKLLITLAIKALEDVTDEFFYSRATIFCFAKREKDLVVVEMLLSICIVLQTMNGTQLLRRTTRTVSSQSHHARKRTELKKISDDSIIERRNEKNLVPVNEIREFDSSCFATYRLIKSLF